MHDSAASEIRMRCLEVANSYATEFGEMIEAAIVLESFVLHGGQITRDPDGGESLEAQAENVAVLRPLATAGRA